ncbi:hypothetical protein CTA2_905 [Colletotrichum tanaceti]|nr:hypothetical protein CTA2_905 [Colletotrichum tanaceti]
MRTSWLVPLLAAASGPAVAVAVLEERQIFSSSTLAAVNSVVTSSVFSAPTSVLAPTVNSSVYDLSQHFCRIWRHASVYADGKIYIDGGNTYVPRNGKTFYNTEAKDYGPGMRKFPLELSHHPTI